MSVEKIKSISTLIIVTSGAMKCPAILSALHGIILDIFIPDAKTVEWLINKDPNQFFKEIEWLNNF